MLRGLLNTAMQGCPGSKMHLSILSYLVPCAASLWKAPALPSRLCQMTSRLVGKAYVAAGQARPAEHCTPCWCCRLIKSTFWIILIWAWVYLRRVLELLCVSDLALQATKQVARAVGHSIAALLGIFSLNTWDSRRWKELFFLLPHCSLWDILVLLSRQLSRSSMRRGLNQQCSSGTSSTQSRSYITLF